MSNLVNPVLNKTLSPIVGGGPGQRETYYDHVTEFTHICPMSLITGDRLGTNIGRARTTPKFVFDDVERDTFDPTHGAWPVRMKYWGKASTRTDPEEAKFYEFHIYDIAETTETMQGCVSWLHPRFLSTLRPSGTVITLMGMSSCGKRVAVHVFGTYAYFYMKKRDTDRSARVTCPSELAHAMAESLKNSVTRNHMFRAATADSFVIDIVTRRDIYYFETQPEEYYRVRVCNSKFMSYLCDNFCPNVAKYEGGVDATTRFILDHGMTSFGWYKFVRGSGAVQIREPRWHSTSSDVEINCLVDNLEITDRSDWPDYKLLSFDIECKAGGSNDLAFPSAERAEDVVIQISAVVYSIATKKVELEILFSLGTCELPDAEPGEVNHEVRVCECGSEFELIVCFMTFLKQYSPEIVTGYNILGFDWAFLYNKMLNVYGMRVDGYGKMNAWGTFRVCELSKHTFGKARKVKISGLINLDMLPICTEKLKLPSYKLDAVVESVLGEHKVDLAYKDLPVFFARGPSERGLIGNYCMHDSRLVGRLFFKFLPHMELSAVAKLACIPLSRALFDGQQLRVFTCLLQRAGRDGFVLPDQCNRFSAAPSGDSVDVDDIIRGGRAAGSRTTGYQGAKVLDPEIGFHVSPVMVFDFASLYPSIIQANNLCYSTLTHDPGAVAHLKPDEDYIRVDVQGRELFFVREHVRKSLLGDLLSDWLAMRRAIRARIKTAQTEEERVLLDKQQLAIKVVCNSVYGFTGVASGMLPCLQIAATVTTIGRAMLMATKEYAETKWAAADKFRELFPEAFGADHANGAERHSVSVIYGDTDSVFIKITGVPIDGLVKAGDRMADEITNALFRRPVKLECEKTFTRLLMIAKKKYIGVIHGGKMLMKGVDLVRKTNCKYVNKSTKMLVDLLFLDDGVARAAAEASRVPLEEWAYRPLPDGFARFGAVLAGAHASISEPNLDVRDFVMTAELSRAPEQYTNNKIAHLIVYHKRVARNEQPPQIKERIEYVMAAPGQAVAGDPALLNPSLRESKLISSLAEDPAWLSAHSLRLNTDYYFTNLIRTLSVTFNALFKGDTKTTEAVLKSFIPDRFRYSTKTLAALAGNTRTFAPLPGLACDSA